MRLPSLLLVLSLLIPLSAAEPTADLDALVAALRVNLDARIAQRQGVGIVVGIADGERRVVIVAGHARRGDAAATVDQDTLFEIGSVTKVFTCLLLAEAVARGEAGLDDPIARFLPPGSATPSRDGRAITLRTLAQHTSSLPRLPDDLAPSDTRDPYAQYDAARLHAFLARFQPPRAIGGTYEYSNLGMGLLGDLLARAARQDYERLVVERICVPLGLPSTRIILADGLAARLAVGHDQALAPTPGWNLAALAGAGGLRSSVRDLLALLVASRAPAGSPLAAALAVVQEHALPTGQPGLSVALGWHLLERDGRRIVTHSGGTGGYRSFVGFAPGGRAVAVLANSVHGIDDLGMHALDPTMPLARFDAPVAIDPSSLAPLVGDYALGPQFVLTIFAERGRLFGQATNQLRMPLIATSATTFVNHEAQARLAFTLGADGRASGLVLTQGGRDLPAPRIAPGHAAAPKVRIAIDLDPRLHQRLLGSYQLAPGFAIAITADGDRLVAQATGQPAHEILPLSEWEFFYTVVDARVVFAHDAEGRVTGMVLHQNGRELPGTKLP